jgi:hypothetical protein
MMRVKPPLGFLLLDFLRIVFALPLMILKSFGDRLAASRLTVLYQESRTGRKRQASITTQLAPGESAGTLPSHSCALK